MSNDLEHIQILDDVLLGKFTRFDVSFIHKIATDFSLRTETKAMVFGLLNRLDHHYKLLGKSAEWHKMTNNLIEFIERNFSIEEAAIAINAVKQTPYNLPLDSESFYKRNRHYYGH